ncbi:MAG TPA: hypothetical protein V6C97_22985 [Oculatellaceae cyanobacterium]
MTSLDIFYRDKEHRAGTRIASLQLETFCPRIILGLFVLFLCCWNYIFFVDVYVAGWDLPGHIAAVEKMMQQIPHFRTTFFDPGWFAGWAFDSFYAPLGHIVTAVLAYPLALISKDPAQYATHLCLGLGSALLPLSVWYFSAGLARSMKRGRDLTAAEATILALSVCFLTFWFLNNDKENNNLGWGAIMGIGLYTQLFAWHLFLLHGGALVRLIETGKRRYEVLCATLFGALFLTHTLTGLLSFGFVLLLSFWYWKQAWQLWRVHLIGLALTSYWFLPAVVYGKQVSVVSTIKGSGDMLEVMFRYPTNLLVRHTESCLAGHGGPIDAAYLLVPLYFALMFILPQLRRSSVFVAFCCTDIVAYIVTGSAFVAKCFNLTIHYYRFLGDELLVLMALMALVPFALMQPFYDNESQGKWHVLLFKKAVLITLILVNCVGIYSTIAFANPNRQKVIDLYNKTPANQDEVIDYFRKQTLKGRVFFEFFDDDGKYGSWAAHYLESRLFQETGFESMSGLFIESSNAYRLPGTAMANLDAHVWVTCLVFSNPDNKSEEQQIRQLKECGVTHIVCGKDSKVFEKIKTHLLNPPNLIGPFAICQIAPLPLWQVAPLDANKTLVGYVDKAGTLPFEYLQFYAFTNNNISSKFEFIDMTKRRPIPDVPIVITNTGENVEPLKISDSRDLVKTRPLQINFAQYDLIDDEHVWYQESPELDYFVAVSDYMKRFQLAKRLEMMRDSLPEKLRLPQPYNGTPTFDWADSYQSIILKNLEPGKLVKVDYSYLPFWHSSQADIYQGTNAQMYVLPRANAVRLNYNQLQSVYYWVGLLLSLSSLVYLVGYSKPLGLHLLALEIGERKLRFKNRLAVLRRRFY